jgi:nicotinate-nucleotide adenylyltransferase
MTGAAHLPPSGPGSTPGTAALPGDARRVGVFGGTFDPPHNGHLTVATWVREALELDVMVVVVSGEPWQKVDDRAVTPSADRLAMVQAMCDGLPATVVSDIEVRRAGPSFTADTLAAFHAPGRELFLVVGHDAAAGLPTWERVEEVRRRCIPVLVDRRGVAAPQLPGGWEWRRVDLPRLDISSTMLRDRLERGLVVDGLVPPEVIASIGRRGLYGCRPAGDLRRPDSRRTGT